jgi:hypothetical protein
MIIAQDKLPNPFMVEPTRSTKESRELVQKLIDAIAVPKVKTKRRKPQMRLAMNKR